MVLKIVYLYCPLFCVIHDIRRIDICIVVVFYPCFFVVKRAMEIEFLWAIAFAFQKAIAGSVLVKLLTFSE